MPESVNIAGVYMAAVDFGQMLKNAKATFTNWGGILISLVGLIMLIWCGVKVAKGLMTHGKEPTNWFMVFALGLVGAAFLVGGLALIMNIAGGASDTLLAIVNGTGSA